MQYMQYMQTMATVWWTSRKHGIASQQRTGLPRTQQI
jgi:hypothetical protein